MRTRNGFYGFADEEAKPQRAGRGVVGSTSNILDFIGQQVDRAVASGRPEHLRFVLGTESGMVTSIARRVRARPRGRRRRSRS